MKPGLLVCTVFLLVPASGPAEDKSAYTGSQACAKCHPRIAAVQSRSNMALTWQPVSAFAAYSKQKTEGSIEYRVSDLRLRVKMPGRPAVSAPVEALVGGKRHGVSFLARVREIEGAELARAPLVEARYLHASDRNDLALSPGFPADTPATWETAAGRALTPSFEEKCLRCHGAPKLSPVGEAGIQCETCHGPGQSHPAKPILNPAKLSNEQSIELCAQCHAGFSELADPLPQDVLISSQATAMRQSECYIQSDRGFSCLSCHDPHQNSRADDPAYVKTCLGCHAAGAGKAASCPVNAKDKCIGCHMPTEQSGTFALTDHWIRVHPGSFAPRQSHTDIPPRRVFLRMLMVAGKSEADEMHRQLVQGASFFELARRHSIDPSAASGGFAGEMWIANMDGALAGAAARLAPGQISDVVASGGNYVILQRMPRDFRAQAIALEEAGSALKDKRQFDLAIAKYQQALQLNPYFLRALVFLGVSFGEKGEKERAAAALEQAALLFPKDPSAHYNLGIAYGALGRNAEEIAEYRKALDLEPSLVPAWMNLGAAFLSASRPDQAADIYHQGLQMNPLSAALYYNLGLIKQQQGNAGEARRAFTAAEKIDSRFHHP